MGNHTSVYEIERRSMTLETVERVYSTPADSAISSSSTMPNGHIAGSIR